LGINIIFDLEFVEIFIPMIRDAKIGFVCKTGASLFNYGSPLA
jgi:hypothetical protein